MKQLLIALLVLASGPLSLAQQAKVIKVKGTQAIVQFKNGQPQVGQVLEVGGVSEDPSFEAESRFRSQRKNTITITGLELSLLSNSQSSKSTTVFVAAGRYGWNLGNIEAGPLVTLGFSTTDSSSTRRFGFGGFFDYNLVPNKSGTSLVYGVGAEGAFASDSTSVGSAESSVSTIQLAGGGNLKWFGLADNIALRVDAGYSMSRTTTQSNIVSTDSGLRIRGGLGVYF